MKIVILFIWCIIFNNSLLANIDSKKVDSAFTAYEAWFQTLNGPYEKNIMASKTFFTERERLGKPEKRALNEMIAGYLFCKTHPHQACFEQP